ncbi:putative HTH-type transcriptional regulator y4qH [Mesorhizobium plurifarium]|uniref:Putative HTH-type transcriptional regulator y4qH n=1 Tax=Mesorhizobium plurifarium TaxID=69974 RepID=A0A090F2V7_MESPL|nr:putative HTH-type transcriptional regulator y4qH [Mesorhizobium plurifarium]
MCTSHDIRRKWLRSRGHGTLVDDWGAQLRRPATRVPDHSSLTPSIHLANPVGEAFGVTFGQFLDQTDDIAKSQQLFDALSAFVLNFGCLWIAYSSHAHDQQSLRQFQSDPAMTLNYHEKWQERYLEIGYYLIDPIVKIGRKRPDAFRWREVYEDASTTEDERRVFDEAATFGLRSGMSVPLHGPKGSLALMSFAKPWDREFENGEVAYLQLAALYFHQKVIKLENSRDSRVDSKLSPRERECVLWVAKGKTAWEIGKILSISANTVNFHLKNVMRKLGVRSRTVAAIKAIELGIVEL